MKETPDIVKELREEERRGDIVLNKYDDKQISKNKKDTYLLFDKKQIFDKEKEWFKLLLEILPIGIFKINKDGRFLYTNCSFRQIFNISLQESYDILFKDLLFEFDTEKSWNSLIEEMEKKEISSYEGKINNSKGEYNWIKIKSTSMLTDSEIFYVGTLEDITNTKNTQEAIKIKDFAISSSINAIVITDLDGKITYVNKSFQKMWGYSNDKNIIGKPLVRFWKKKGQSIMILDTLYSNGYWFGELIAERDDKATFPVQLSAHMVSDNNDNNICMMASFIDITDRKNAENDLKKHQRKIERQNIQLKKLDRIKSDFLNITSHELRTPMSAIKGYVQMMLKQSLGEISSEQVSALNIVLRNANRLDNLIQDILDISRLESGSMKFVAQKTDAVLILKEAVDTMKLLAKDKDMTINIECDKNIPTINIDRDRIQQVLINLINNAIKFSENGSEINTRIKLLENFVLFQVEDFGRGVPKNKQSKVFEIFYQSDSGVDRKFGGAGLGLAISRGIILSHGGKIWVENKVGKGCIFQFIIPIDSVEDIESRFKEIDVFSINEK